MTPRTAQPIARRRYDLGAFIGGPLAIGMVLAAHMIEGGNARSLWQPAAALVVIGGAIGAVFVSYPASAVFRAIRVVWYVCTHQTRPPEQIVGQVIRHAQQMRRKGVLALETELDGVNDPFLKDALTLVVDGARAETVRDVLAIEREAQREVLESSADVLETAAGYTPTLGILGAVLGLIHVMESLSEPSRLGAGIAVAFVATVYGVGIANLILLPLATKLRTWATTEALRREIIIEGVVAMQEGLNPRFIAQKLQGYLAPVQRAAAGERAA